MKLKKKMMASRTVRGRRYAHRLCLIMLGLSLLAVGVTTSLPSGVHPVAEAAEPVTGFQPVKPLRVFDTRPGLPGALAVPKQSVAGAPLPVRVTDLGELPESGVSAVSLNVTVTNTSGPGYVTVYPCGQQPPTASNLNFQTGQTVPNAVIVPVSADGHVCFFSSTPTDLLADINGWFPVGESFTPVAPQRVFDTRPDQAQGAVAISKQPVTTNPLKISVDDIPDLAEQTAIAVSLNVTVTNPSAEGFVTVYPCGELPDVSNLNYRPGQTVPNAVIVPVSDLGEICFYSHVPTDLIADINGYFGKDSAIEVGKPLRLVDTRPSAPPDLQVTPLSSIGYTDLTLNVGDPAKLAEINVQALSLNVTVVNPRGPGFVTVYPCGELATASNLNFEAGQTVPNAVIVPISDAGDICVHSLVHTDILIDINGVLTG